MTNNPTNKDILLAMNSFAQSVEDRFDGLDKRVAHLESQMVTKSYLDDKLFDLRGDLILLSKKADQKLTKLVTILTGKKILTSSDANDVLSMEPFPNS